METVSDGIQEPYFPAEVNDRVPYMLRVQCMVWATLLMLGLLTISNFSHSEEEERRLQEY
jgi:hypothetical protein